MFRSRRARTSNLKRQSIWQQQGFKLTSGTAGECVYCTSWSAFVKITNKHENKQQNILRFHESTRTGIQLVRAICRASFSWFTYSNAVAYTCSFALLLSPAGVVVVVVVVCFFVFACFFCFVFRFCLLPGLSACQSLLSQTLFLFSFLAVT